jgi:hypothetical protein
MENYTILEGNSARPSDRFATETNDCTVNALANVTQSPYPVAHAYLKRAGRRDRHGFRTYSHFGSSRTALGHNFTYLNLHGSGSRTMTVARFVQTHPRGRFLVCISRHALCVADGVIIDSARAKPRARVKSAWRVERIDAAPTTPAVASKAPAPAGGSLKMRKVARGHFRAVVPITVRRGPTVYHLRANLDILSGRYTGLTNWTWKLFVGDPVEVNEVGQVPNLAAGKALFASPDAPHRNWNFAWQIGLGWTLEKTV